MTEVKINAAREHIGKIEQLIFTIKERGISVIENLPFQYLQKYACIALGTSGNIQGSQKVFGIYTRRVLRLRKMIEFPIPDRLVNQMNSWGRQ